MIPEIGKIILPGEKADRDAIHVAIIPATSDILLYPGQAVGVVDKLTPKVSVVSDSPVGIVDPFLKDRVFPGQWFYVFLFPQTVSNLRHDWTHSAFAGNVAIDSQKWLENFAVDRIYAYGDETSYQRMMQDVKDYLARGTCANDDWHSIELNDEFWNHCQNVLGEEISADNRTEFIPCSC